MLTHMLRAAAGSSKGFTVIGTKAVAVTENSYANISLTDFSGGSVAAGDIIIVGQAFETSTNPTLSLSGYTTIADLYVNDNDDANLGVFYKIATSGDTQITGSSFGFRGRNAVILVCVVRGVNQVTPLDVTSTTTTAINTIRPTPPSITPATTGAMFVCVAVGAAGTTGQTFSASQLSNFISNSAASNRGIGGIGTLEGGVAGTSRTFTQWTYSASDSTAFSTASCTVALRPA